jgi:hypothetical protein
MLNSFRDVARAIPIVQSRLNVAALALTALVFSSSFSIGLYGIARTDTTLDFRKEFLDVLTAVATGVAFSVTAIACFILSSHLISTPSSNEVTDRPELASDRSTAVSFFSFCLGQNFLYLGLAAAVSASLTEVVYGIGLSSQKVALALGILVLPVWLVLLFIGPIAFNISAGRQQGALGRVMMWAVYIISIVTTVVIWANTYSLQSHEPWQREVLNQIVQPLTWRKAWH